MPLLTFPFDHRLVSGPYRSLVFSPGSDVLRVDSRFHFLPLIVWAVSTLFDWLLRGVRKGGLFWGRQVAAVRRRYAPHAGLPGWRSIFSCIVRVYRAIQAACRYWVSFFFWQSCCLFCGSLLVSSATTPLTCCVLSQLFYLFPWGCPRVKSLLVRLRHLVIIF